MQLIQMEGFVDMMKAEDAQLVLVPLTRTFIGRAPRKSNKQISSTCPKFLCNSFVQPYLFISGKGEAHELKKSSCACLIFFHKCIFLCSLCLC